MDARNFIVSETTFNEYWEEITTNAGELVKEMYIDAIPSGTQITPLEVIEPGDPVRIRNKIGYVLSHEIKQAVPCGDVVVHEIRLTKKMIRMSPRRYRIVNIDEPIFPSYVGVYKL